jgi:hypothetical protein
MSTALLNGLQIVLVVSVMAVVVTPLLCWVLPDRIHPAQENGVA